MPPDVMKDALGTRISCEVGSYLHMERNLAHFLLHQNLQGNNGQLHRLSQPYSALTMGYSHSQNLVWGGRDFGGWSPSGYSYPCCGGKVGDLEICDPHVRMLTRIGDMERWPIFTTRYILALQQVHKFCIPSLIRATSYTVCCTPMPWFRPYQS